VLPRICRASRKCFPDTSGRNISTSPRSWPRPNDAAHRQGSAPAAAPLVQGNKQTDLVGQNRVALIGLVARKARVHERMPFQVPARSTLLSPIGYVRVQSAD